MGERVVVACVGDVMLDVIVEVPHQLVVDDDTPASITFAAGGQAANVAAWVAALGGDARVYGPHTEAGHGALVASTLDARGVRFVGPEVSRPGAVVSLVSAGTRSMASDPGDSSWLERVEPGPWLDGVDWLFVSGYALLRAVDHAPLVATAAAARSRGARVAVDLASAALVADFGADRFRELWESLEPSAVFANDAEWAATNGRPPGRVRRPSGFGTGGRSVLVLKHGPDGATFVIDGIADDRPTAPGPVVDVTGAGDSLTAGFLVGGADLAMTTAARCVAQVGAQPQSGGRA